MINPLRPVADRLERNAKILRDFGELIESDPTLLPLLREALNASKNGHLSATTPVPVSAQKLDDGTLFERIKADFEEHGNAWTTAPDLRKRLGCKRGAVGAVLYQTHAKYFESKSHPTSKKLKLWRMKGG